MKNSTNPSSIKSKTEITNALLTLMQQYPYSEITVKQIVLETTLVRKTFYRNFNSKDDVLNSYIESLLSEYVHTIMKPGSNVFETIFSFCSKYRELFQILYENNILYLLLQNMNQLIPKAHNNVVSVRRNCPFLFNNLDPEYIIAFNVGAIYNIIAKWVERGMTDSLDEVCQTLTSYLSSGPLSSQD